MNETSSGSFSKNVRFVVNWNLNNPDGPGGQEMKNSMTFDSQHCLSQEMPMVFFASQPRVEFSDANTDRAIFQQVAQQAERKRIAQELHDTLLQGFTCVALKLDVLSNSLPPGLSKTKEQLQKILEQTDEYLAEARRSIWDLRSNTMESPQDFPKRLAKASERALAGTGIRLNFSVHGAARKIKSNFADNLVRVCEEAVANAVKHAGATEVEVTLEFSCEAVQLRVRDDGCGFSPACAEAAKMGHFGLIGMQERLEALSGMLSIDSAPGRGTSVWVIIPTDGRRGNRGRDELMVPMRTTWLWAEARYT